MKFGFDFRALSGVRLAALSSSATLTASFSGDVCSNNTMMPYCAVLVVTVNAATVRMESVIADAMRVILNVHDCNCFRVSVVFSREFRTRLTRRL